MQSRVNSFQTIESLYAWIMFMLTAGGDEEFLLPSLEELPVETLNFQYPDKIDHPTNSDHPGYYNCTILHVALLYKKNRIISKLRELGVDETIQNNEGKTVKNLEEELIAADSEAFINSLIIDEIHVQNDISSAGLAASVTTRSSYVDEENETVGDINEDALFEVNPFQVDSVILPNQPSNLVVQRELISPGQASNNSILKPSEPWLQSRESTAKVIIDVDSLSGSTDFDDEEQHNKRNQIFNDHYQNIKVSGQVNIAEILNSFDYEFKSIEKIVIIYLPPKLEAQIFRRAVKEKFKEAGVNNYFISYLIDGRLYVQYTGSQSFYGEWKKLIESVQISTNQTNSQIQKNIQPSNGPRTGNQFRMFSAQAQPQPQPTFESLMEIQENPGENHKQNKLFEEKYHALSISQEKHISNIFELINEFGIEIDTGKKCATIYMPLNKTSVHRDFRLAVSEKLRRPCKLHSFTKSLQSNGIILTYNGNDDFNKGWENLLKNMKENKVRKIREDRSSGVGIQFIQSTPEMVAKEYSANKRSRNH